MRYQHILQAVYGAPWAIMPTAWYAIHQIVMSKVLEPQQVSLMAISPDGATVQRMANWPEGKRPNRDIWGDAIDQMDFQEGIARIPVKGALIQKAGMIDKMCGAVSHEDIHEDLEKALETKGLRGIILDFDCPGGMIMGTPELAKRVAEASKAVPIYGFTDSTRCSAAEWIAAGCAKLFATESSWVGNVGVIWEIRNVSKALEAAGIDYKVFASGDLKALGHPAVPMSDEHEAWFENEVEQEAATFRKWMKENRPQIGKEYLQGQPVKGRDGFNGGFIDAVVRNIDEVYGLF